MTIPTNTGIQTALSGLQAYQAAISTTGNNIANASTPGYSRQEVDLGESDPLTVEALSSTTGQGSQLGTGVSIDDISRVRDSFLDVQYRTQNANSSYNSELSDQLGQVQTALGGSSGSGVASALSGFWSSWNSLANDPTPAAYTAVASSAQTLTSTLNAVSQQMSTVKTQDATQLSTLIQPKTATQAGGEVEQDASQIASLNTQIKTEHAAGISANSLLDERDSALDDLSSLANTTVTTNTDGSVSVQFGADSSGNGGVALVDANNQVNLPTTADLTSASGGQLGALMLLTDPNGVGNSPIDALSNSLDTVAQTVISDVNGTTASPNPAPPTGNGGFFTGTDAADIGVSSAVTASPSSSTIAIASSASSGNDIAKQIAAYSGDNSNADGQYAAFVGDVGSTVQGYTNAATTATALTTAVNSQRESVSGVSLDEEMSNLITYQQGYEASAKMMSTLDSVISDLINTVGS